MKSKKTKKLLTSLFLTIPILAVPASLGIYKSASEINLVSNKLNANQNYLADATAVTDTSITNFKNYIVSYSDQNIAPVNIVFNSNLSENNQNLSNVGAQIGMTTNKQTITCTTYNGLMLWNSKLTENKLIKNYYNNVKKIQIIDSFKVINYAYLEEK
ncbi:MAG: hypothetical protein K2J02_03860 [Malacoplasma sp.]|nr:hypothetical protein [Malacoplasma sp.]